MNLRTVIVDDEPLAVDRLRSLVLRLPNVEVVGTAASGREALDLLVTTVCDLILLDVEMPDLDGFDTADVLAGQTGISPSVVFVTAHNVHAVGAFDVGVADFLTKPVRIKRLEAAIERVRTERRNAAAARYLVESEGSHHGVQRMSATGEELWISRHGEKIRVNLLEVIRVEAEGEYVRLFLPHTNYLHRAALSLIYRHLDPAVFVRIHRSTVIRRMDVAAVRRASTGRYSVLLNDGSSLPVGKTYKAAVRAL